MPLDPGPDAGAPGLVEDCNTLGDEDGNGFGDCQDPVCARTPGCLVACGNGVKESGEQCDDGNRVDGDTCESDCTLPSCGNGVKDAGEQCDDGNRANGDTCESDCTRPSCGNRILDVGEQCDDGNQLNTDGCAPNCTRPFCGNHIIDDRGTNEQCDDGNHTDGDTCESDCTRQTCGNHIKDPGEQCDDGNDSDGDGCEINCTLPRCGNKIKDEGEQCDDGNTGNSTCKADCTRPMPPDCSDGRPAVSITSPGAGTTVTTGADLSVTIEFCGFIPDEFAVDAGDHSSVVVRDQPFISPVTVSVPISALEHGRVSLRALVSTATGDAKSAVPVNLNVNAALRSIFAGHNSDALLRSGRTRQLAAVGTYADPPSREITHMTGTTYEVSSGPLVVATVSPSGLVTGVNPGLATVTVRNGAISTSVPVTVVAQVCGDGYLDVDEQCDDDNTNNGDGCDSSCQFEPPSFTR